LQSIGCTEMQGYLFSKARPAGEIRQFFTQGAFKDDAFKKVSAA